MSMTTAGSAPRRARCASPSTSAARSPTSPPSTRAPARCCWASGRARRATWSRASCSPSTRRAATSPGEPGAVHGSTVVINAVLERRGARTALVTTRGLPRRLRDRPHQPARVVTTSFFRKHVPLVPRSRRFEVEERLDAEGEVLIPFDEAQAEALARDLARQGVEAVAVVFLHAYRNPAHELRMREVLRAVAPSLFVTLSHELSREYREYERTRTTVANAFVGPIVRGYLDHLEQLARERGFRGTLLLMQSNGGLYRRRDGRASSASRCWSRGPPAAWPARGAVRARWTSPNAIGFDMGGTTAKAALIEGGIARRRRRLLRRRLRAGLAIRMPVRGHPRGRHRRRLAWPGSTRRARSTSGRRAPAPSPARSATAAAASSPRSPTPTWCSAASTSAASLGGEHARWTARPRARALEERVAARWASSSEAAAAGIVRIAVANMAQRRARA